MPSRRRGDANSSLPADVRDDSVDCPACVAEMARQVRERSTSRVSHDV